MTNVSAEPIQVFNPATDECVGAAPSMNANDVRHLIDVAFEAWGSWRASTARVRGAKIAALAHRMHQDQHRLAALLTAEQGKPLREAQDEIASAASSLVWAAEEGRRMSGELIPASRTNQRVLVLRAPIGVTSIVTPAEFPAAALARKLGPALAAGCPVIITPAEDTPLTALAIAALARDAELPDGLITVATGDHEMITDVFCEDARIRKLAFTGSPIVGRQLMRKGAEHLLRLSLELGGPAPFIVFEDADLDAAVNGAMASAFLNAGQTSLGANRFYVQSAVHDEFVERMTHAIESLRIGPGTSPGVDIGPLLNDTVLARAESVIEDACRHGADCRIGGTRARHDGLADRFLVPTLLTGMTPQMCIAREETHGPVIAVAAFRSEAEAIAAANDSEYGLAAYFYTQDANRLIHVCEALEAGVIGVNDADPNGAHAPIGGVKHSGTGRHGGREGMAEYTETKYVSWGV